MSIPFYDLFLEHTTKTFAATDFFKNLLLLDVRETKGIWGNEEVKAKIGNAVGPYVDLLTLVKRRKLK